MTHCDLIKKLEEIRDEYTMAEDEVMKTHFANPLVKIDLFDSLHKKVEALKSAIKLIQILKGEVVA
jgi:hypothetical protein